MLEIGAMAAAPAPESRKFNHFSEIAGFIWQVADLLRGDYKQSDYRKVILPFTVLRRRDCARCHPPFLAFLTSACSRSLISAKCAASNTVSSGGARRAATSRSRSSGLEMSPTLSSVSRIGVRLIRSAFSYVLIQ